MSDEILNGAVADTQAAPQGASFLLCGAGERPRLPRGKLAAERSGADR